MEPFKEEKRALPDFRSDPDWVNRPLVKNRLGNSKGTDRA